MKTNIIGVIIALLLAFAGAIGALAQDERVSEVRKVDDFSSIRIKAVANVEFTQGDKYGSSDISSDATVMQGIEP